MLHSARQSNPLPWGEGGREAAGEGLFLRAHKCRQALVLAERVPLTLPLASRAGPSLSLWERG
jgi:hypothetical protein